MITKNTKPEALRLAEELERLLYQLDPVDDWRPHIYDASIELSRQHAEIAHLNRELYKIPEGCTPKDAQLLRKANHELAIESHEKSLEIDRLRAASDAAYNALVSSLAHFPQGSPMHGLIQSALDAAKEERNVG